jgi:Flp pilus assembly protein TadD
MWSNCCTRFAQGRSAAGHTGALALGAAVLLLAGCTSTPRAPEPAADQRFEHAAAALETGAEREALALLAELNADYPTLAGPLVNLGILHAAAGRHDEAEAAFRQAIDLAPRHAVAWAELGIVLRRQGRFTAADQAYRQALELQPGYALAWRNRGVLLDLYLGRPAEALECYERYLELLGEPKADEQVARWVAELRLRNGSRVATR